ncbi:hypothetical protein BJF78_14070 [Pseudonocardia sp. CNS-139]|nr:hypothetical protein BJF78_14070 [Pseudonocardia sp. CNS-139]
MLDAEFDAAVTGTVNVAVERAADADLDRYAAALSAIPDVAEVRTPVGLYVDGERTQQATIINSVMRDGDTGYVAVVPDDTVEDISPESIAIVRAVHATDAPFTASVSGPVATLVDSQDAIAELLPVAVVAIVVVTFAVLFLLTGGLLVSVVAIASNALSLVAMYGVVVWVFQDGNLSGLLGFEPTGYIDTFLPVLMFCVAFGLSMDYGVFLLARIREEYERTGDHRGAVAAGLQRTGGIITAAALILSVVLVAVGTSRITNSMMLGWGGALAVLVDATIVRCLLVPAVLGMLGPRVWWRPRRCAGGSGASASASRSRTGPRHRRPTRAGPSSRAVSARCGDDRAARPAARRAPHHRDRAGRGGGRRRGAAAARPAPPGLRGGAGRGDHADRPDTGRRGHRRPDGRRGRRRPARDVPGAQRQPLAGPVHHTRRDVRGGRAPHRAGRAAGDARHGRHPLPARLLDGRVVLAARRARLPPHRGDGPARAASVTVDRLGYGASDHVNGFHTCVGAQADVADQIVQQLRAGTYAVEGRPAPAFAGVTLAGLGTGAQIAQLATLFGHADGLVVMGFADMGRTDRFMTRVFGNLSTCMQQVGPDQQPTSAGGYSNFDVGPNEYRQTNFHDTDPAVLAAALPQQSAHPCKEVASQLEAITTDLRSLGTVAVPVLGVYGAEDRLFQGGAAHLALFTGARSTELVTVPGAGHYMGLERAAPVLHDALAAWLAAHRGGPR